MARVNLTNPYTAFVGFFDKNNNLGKLQLPLMTFLPFLQMLIRFN